MTAPTRPQLTEQQMTVLRLIAAGLRHAEIAEQLRYTPTAVTAMANRIFLNLGAWNAPHAVFLACQAGLLDGRPRRHGDHAGYAAHLYRGEDPKACPLGCWEGELAYRADRRQAKRGQEAASAPVCGPEARKT